MRWCNAFAGILEVRNYDKSIRCARPLVACSATDRVPAIAIDFGWRKVPDSQNIYLDIPFKGSRTYLRFADIFPALIELAWVQFGVDAQVESLTIRKPFTHVIQVLFEQPPLFSATFKIRNGAEEISGWLVETDQPVPERVPLDAAPLTRAIVSGPGFAGVPCAVAGHTAFDVLAGLMKQVGERVDSHFWWLCQMNLATPLTEAYPLGVRVRRNLGERCLVFDIVQADVPIGTARFIADSVIS